MNSVSDPKKQPNIKPISQTPREAFEHLKTGAAIVDIRPEYETCFRVFDVPKVFYISYRTFQDEFHTIPKDLFLIVADSAGNRSAMVAEFFAEQGYSQIAYLSGGMVEWDRDGLPIAKDKDYEMVGGCACRLHPQKERPEGSSVAPKKEL